MCVVDRQYRYVWVNDALCERLGYGADELIGQSPITVTHEADADLDLRLSQRVIDGEISHFTVRKRYVCKDGSGFVGDLVVSALVDDHGNPTAGFGTLIPVD